MKEALRKAIGAHWVEETEDLFYNDPSKRWCNGTVALGSISEVIYTIEWINESDGRFWVSAKSRPHIISLEKAKERWRKIPKPWGSRPQ